MAEAERRTERDPWESLKAAWVSLDLPDNARMFLKVVALLVVFVSVLCLGLALGSGYGVEKAAQLGDAFGVVNALFSGLALLGVVCAILLQHQELEVARREAKEGEAARLESVRLLTRQADVLLAAARLNAADSLVQAYKAAHELDASSSRDPSSPILRYRQLQQILLNDLIERKNDGSGLLALDLAPYKRHANILMERAKHDLCDIFQKAPKVGVGSAPLLSCRGELRVLRNQDGVPGSMFAGNLDTAIDIISRILDRDEVSFSSPEVYLGELRMALQTADWFIQQET